MKEKTQKQGELQPENVDHKHGFISNFDYIDYGIKVPKGFWKEVHDSLRFIETIMCNHPAWWGNGNAPIATSNSFILNGYEYTVKIRRGKKVI